MFGEEYILLASMTPVEIVSIIGGLLLGGGGIGVIFDYLRNRKKDRKDGFKELVKAQQELSDEQQEFYKLKEDDLLKKIAILEKRLEKCKTLEDVISELKEKLLLLEIIGDQSPFPTWVKSPPYTTDGGTMITLNDAYEEYFLKPLGYKKRDYIGKIDRQIWGEEVHKSYYENDKWCMEHPDKVFIGKELIDLKGHKVGGLYRIYKKALMFKGRVVAIWGMCVPVDEVLRA